FNQPHHSPYHRFHDINANCHLRQLVLDGSEFRDGGTECLAVPGIFQADGKHIFGCTNRTRTQLQPSQIQDVEGDDVSAANLSQHVLDWDAHIVEIYGRSRASLHTHLVFFGAAADSGKTALDQKCRELFPSHLGEYGKEIRGASVGDPHLLPVQHVILAVRTQISPSTY